jgi:hypothetical protein
MNLDPSAPKRRQCFGLASVLGQLVLALSLLAGLGTPAGAVPLRSAAVPPPAPDDSPLAVSFGVWLAAVTDLLDSTPAPAIDHEYSRFVATHRLPADDAKLKQDFRRLRLLFEAIRDGGFWHLQWAVTDQEPSSRVIWRNWIRDPVRSGFAEPSATAECDELSALFGMLARHLRIYNVGLFYPRWNHTISVWAPLEGKAKTSLIQLPTTQIFLDCNAGFDQTTFHTQLRGIERYPNWDVHQETRIPRARADWLLHQIQSYAAASPALWALVRGKRAYAMGSSMGPCLEARTTWYAQLRQAMTEGDVSALQALAKDELGMPKSNPSEVLAWLKE